MLLNHLYDYALSRNLLADLAFAPKAIRWIIDLDAAGNFISAVETGDGKRGLDYSCPQTTRNKNAGGIAEFLADGITAIFGCDTDPEPNKKRTENQEKDRKKNNILKNEDFWEQVEVAATATKHPGLSALRTFCQKLSASDATILQYGKPTGAKADAKSAWLLHISGEEKKLGTENFTFRMDGELLIENVAIRDWWRDQHTAEVNATRGNATRGLCLVTGHLNQPIALTHTPKIEGVPNTSFGAAIVSFDKDAFTSYGFDQSLNAPTSDAAATAYCTALNHLIDKEETSLRLGQTILCFWAVQNKAAGGRFAQLLNKPNPQSVRSFLASPWAGIARDLAKKDTFLAVTLAGNKGRIVVRNWLQQTLEQAINNVHNWFVDLEIRIPPKQHTTKNTQKVDKKTEFNPLSIYWLASALPPLKRDKGAIKPDMDKLRPETPSQLYRAALEGIAPSISLIASILNQFRSRLVGDENFKLVYDDQSRFALLKLILNRNRKETDMEIKTSLTTDTSDPAYNCGRLLSVLSETQKKAQGYPKGFSGVAERYFGTASVSPATVLPLLLRLNRHHLDKIRKSGGNAYEEVIIRNIVAKFKPAKEGVPPVFPRTLDLQGQGRFAIGFYQQQVEDASVRITFKVLVYLEDTDATAHAEALVLQENDPQAFYEKVSQYYGSVAFKEWSDKKQKK